MFALRLTSLLVAGLAITWTSAHEVSHLKTAFNTFEHDFGKKYANQAERISRFAIFSENVKKIDEHNAKGHTWTKAINQFTDLTGIIFTLLWVGSTVLQITYLNLAGMMGNNCRRKKDHQCAPNKLRLVRHYNKD